MSGSLLEAPEDESPYGRHATRGPEQLEEVRLSLQARYSGARLDDLRAAMEGGSREEAAEVAALSSSVSIERLSLSVHGTGRGERVQGVHS